MTRHALSYLFTLIGFLVIDLIWLGVIARDFYRDAFAAAGLSVEIDFAVAFGFYALYVFGIVIFAVSPALDRGSLRHAAVFGGLFGLFCYATYDLTNMATLRDWPLHVSLVDIPWGVALTSGSAAAGYIGTRAVVGETEARNRRL